MRGGRRKVEAKGSHEGRGMRVRTSWKWGEEVSWRGSSLTQRGASHHSGRGEEQGQETPGPVHRFLGHQPLQTLRPLISKARPRPLPGDRSAARLGCCCRRYSWCHATDGHETVRACRARAGVLGAECGEGTQVPASSGPGGIRTGTQGLQAAPQSRPAASPLPT